MSVSPKQSDGEKCGPSPLGEVALLFRTMPYGDYTHFCNEVGADPQTLWGWAEDMEKVK